MDTSSQLSAPKSAPPTSSPTPEFNVQDESLLFTLLNQDVRYLIFTYLFGAKTVHIKYVAATPKGRRRIGPLRPWRNCICAELDWPAHSHAEEDTHRRRPMNASLLRTCRRAYDEGIKILYSTNVLAFKDARSLLYWSFKIQPPRWAMIRRVDVCLTEFSGSWVWADVWQHLSEMPNLQRGRLRVIQDLWRYWEVFIWLGPRPGERSCWRTDMHSGPLTSSAEEVVAMWAKPMVQLKLPEEASVEILFDDAMTKLRGLGPKLRSEGVEGVRIGWARFPEGNAQSASPFFAKLCPEIRRQIFVELFGERLVHVKFSNQGKGSRSFKRNGHPPNELTGWWHCVCRRGRRTMPHDHSEKDHKWCYLPTNFIFTCKRVFHEGTSVLYGTNTLLFESAWDILIFRTQTRGYLGMVKNLDYFFAIGNGIYGERESSNQELGCLPLMAQTIWVDFPELRHFRIRMCDRSNHRDSRRPPVKYRKDAERELVRALKAFSEEYRFLGPIVQVFLSSPSDDMVKSAVEKFRRNRISITTAPNKKSLGQGPESDDEEWEMTTFDEFRRVFPFD
ncbi:hypothetical protein ACJ41O_011479 [Fusarium nematophilum]